MKPSGWICLSMAGLTVLNSSSSAAEHDEALDVYGPKGGDWELTLGGNGSNDKDFDNGGFGANVSIGYFLTEHFEVAVRQGINYSEFDNDSVWDGSTRGAIDYHFDLNRWRPFIGANFGGFYGEQVTDTWAAGLEAGFKFYVKQETFLFAMGEYQWLFKDSDQIDDRFDDGRFVYTLGLGFNF